jgi:hypothetical protein
LLVRIHVFLASNPPKSPFIKGGLAESLLREIRVGLLKVIYDVIIYRFLQAAGV